ncbi:hypothetical protein RIF29_28574 [Crotalaria pallida]|uniref:Uncharacterized protein n=1 Tax=Crotalaria pallida TaxID=3830 RepID=A0AAN9EF22_CROPI
MSITNLQLPNECWELVFTFLSQDHHHLDVDHHRYLEPLSLVSKYFLSITNNLRSSLVISDRTLPHLACLFARFPMLRSLRIRHFTGDLDALLCQISLSSLSLESLSISSRRTIPAIGFRALGKNMKTLKSLSCTHVACLKTGDLLLISECFPFLQELKIGSFKYRYPSQQLLSYN